MTALSASSPPVCYTTSALEIIAQSVRGERNPVNEDAYWCWPEAGIFALADGMGGCGHGEMASQWALTTLCAALQALGKRPLQASHILAAIQVANHRIYESARQNLKLRGMGTTLVIAWIHGQQLHCFHIGDSRIYRLRDFFLKQLTTDHGAALYLIEQGKAKPGAITRALGVKPQVEVDIIQEIWQAQDLLLLVSDGISDPIPHYQLNNILAQPVAELADYAHQLIQVSQQQGGSDDKTLLLVRSV